MVVVIPCSCYTPSLIGALTWFGSLPSSTLHSEQKISLSPEVAFISGYFDISPAFQWAFTGHKVHRQSVDTCFMNRLYHQSVATVYGGTNQKLHWIYHPFRLLFDLLSLTLYDVVDVSAMELEGRDFFQCGGIDFNSASAFLIAACRSPNP